jgi:site-specific DNA-cytosine methylase
MANRNSWSASNPHNELIEVFVKYIRRLGPLGFLMENVQGILWTPNAGTSVSIVDVIERRLKAAGYVLFPKLLDAAWYGVPQNRTRFFLMGLHRDLGYTAADFGAWGPFPKPSYGHRLRPFVTVRDAISDLPRIRNGASAERSSYAEPSDDILRQTDFLRYTRAGAEPGIVSDHVTSRHADYVIGRYRRIPAGGNWESIRAEMTNYADVSRTHSNIYRRLRWDEPSITIGHYRKSMLVHPSQHRGLSLREASRLQSFPDWFRFAGTANGQSGGLVHKQQQLANAVCPLITKAIAEFMLNL